MDAVTQQNAALVEEAAAAAQSLQVQSSQLEQVVSTFRLRAEAQALPAAGPASLSPAKRAQPRLAAAAEEWAHF